MAKRKFHDNAKYAPRRARLLEVGHQMGLSSGQGSIVGVVGLQKGLDHWELSNDPQNPSTSLSSSPAPSDSYSLDVSDSYDDDMMNQGDGDHDDVPEINGDHVEEGEEVDEGGDQGIYELDQNTADGASPKIHHNSTYSFATGRNMRMGIDLLHLCTESQVPLHFYDKVLRIFKEYSVDGSDNSSWCNSIPSREFLLKQIKSKIGFVEPVICSLDSTEDIVTKFPFQKQLLDLFSSQYFEDIHCCCVNEDQASPFGMYLPKEQEGLSELLCGKWYRDTYEERIGNDPLYIDPVTMQEYHKWLVPLKFYNDKTGVSAMEGSYSLEPLMFTVGVLRNKVQESQHAWRHLGFIPARSAKNKQLNEVGGTAEQTLAFTHECLSILLQDVVELQRSPPLVTLKLFGKVYHVQLILEVACVIGDQLSQDTHCCRKKINGGGAGRMHRGCMTSFMNPSEPQQDGCKRISKKVLDHLCESVWLHEDEDRRQAHYTETFPLGGNGNGSVETEIIQVTKIRSEVARDILEKVFSMYPVHNAWSAISFGANKDGIHRATLDDPMHYNSSGLFSYLAEIAFGGLAPKDAEELEGYMREDFANARSSVRYDLPRGKFTAGFTNCTLLTASEKVGLMFSLYLSLGTQRVITIYQRNILRQQRKYLNMSCYQVSRTSADAPKGMSLSESNVTVPRHGVDQYFYKRGPQVNKEYVPMKRTYPAVKETIKRLNRIGLLQGMEDSLTVLDSLQTEYLLQIGWDRFIKESTHKLSVPLTLVSKVIQSGSRLNNISSYLYRQLRQVNPVPRSLDKIPSPPTTIQKTIKKHLLDKPRQVGLGATSAILTDVKGFREVLELALIFHALVYEFHHLPEHLQTDLDLIKEKLDRLMTCILKRIYRGDTGIDVSTCKCHAHFHLTDDIMYFGAPIGYDAGKGERNLKWWAKRISKTARKCGQAVFLEQTSRRVMDSLILQRAKEMITIKESSKPNTSGVSSELSSWQYTRKLPHAIYLLDTGTAKLNECKVYKEGDVMKLFPEQVRDVLKDTHGVSGEIRVWKEVLLTLEDGQGHQRIRAFHDFDAYGSFFDWVHVRLPNGSYLPAKMLLLYEVVSEGNEPKHCALVWIASPATDSERRHETNISARWKMKLLPSGLPNIVSVSTDCIERCILVYPHWKCKDGYHLPTTALNPGSDTSMFVIDESYERYSWLLNFLDDDRWE